MKVAMHDVTFESVENLSQADFAEWVGARPSSDTGHYELLNGRIVMNPPAGWPHGENELVLGGLISTHVRGRKLGRAFGPSQGFELPSGDTIQPDLAFVSNKRWRAALKPKKGKFLRVVPDLVVEILSRSTATRDRGEKKAIYERNGVREYWLVDDRARQVTRFVSHEGRFDKGTIVGEDEVLRSTVLPNLSIAVGEIFAEP